MAPTMFESCHPSTKARLPFASHVFGFFRRWFRLGGVFHVIPNGVLAGILCSFTPYVWRCLLTASMTAATPGPFPREYTKPPYEFVFLWWHDPLVASCKSLCTFQQKHTSCSCSFSARIGGSTTFTPESRDGTISYVPCVPRGLKMVGIGWGTIL